MHWAVGENPAAYYISNLKGALPMSIFETTPEIESSETEHEEISAEVENDEIITEQTEEQESQETDSQEEEHSELLAGKYKSVDDLVKGYKNLEKSFHTQRSQPQAQAQTQPIQQEESDHSDVFWQAFQRDPLAAVNYLVEAAQKPFVEQRETESLTKGFDTVMKQYGGHIKSEDDMNSYFTKVNEIAAEFGNPALIKNPSQRILRMAAEELWGSTTATIYQQAKQAGRQEAEQTRQSKTGIGVQTSKKPPETPKTEDDLIRENILNAGTRNGIFG